MRALPAATLGLFLAAFAAAEPAHDSLPPLSLRQLNHRAFAAAGAPATALAQTADGTLWIGGEAGLARFDGVRFTSYPESAEPPLPKVFVSALATTPEGGLWIGYHSGGVSFLKDGHLRDYPVESGLPRGTVSRFSWSPDGSLWAVAFGGLAHFDGSRWEKVEVEGYPLYMGLLVDRRGTVWAMTPHALIARPAGEAAFREVLGRIDT
jgi:ligand-binding sensor domain-containing protein